MTGSIDIPQDVMRLASKWTAQCYQPETGTWFDVRDVIASAILEERKATALRLADWIETQRKDVPAHGWEFAAAIRELCKLDVLRLNPLLSERQYLEKIADQVIARNSKTDAAISRPGYPRPEIENRSAEEASVSNASGEMQDEDAIHLPTNSKAATTTDNPEAWTPLGDDMAVAAQSGAGVFESVCPALIDDVGGQ